MNSAITVTQKQLSEFLLNVALARPLDSQYCSVKPKSLVETAWRRGAGAGAKIANSSPCLKEKVKILNRVVLRKLLTASRNEKTFMAKATLRYQQALHNSYKSKSRVNVSPSASLEFSGDDGVEGGWSCCLGFVAIGLKAGVCVTICCIGNAPFLKAK
jgi:hypothetical protein